MIKYIQTKDLFDSEAEALVNPVNCKGTMGKGIALEFKKRFPEYFPVYRKACLEGKLRPGILLYQKLILKPQFYDIKAIICFPTKDNWKQPSKLEWIDKGLSYLKEHYQEWGINSVAMTELGCGLGGLKWPEVQSLIIKYFQSEPFDVEVYSKATLEYGERTSNKITDYFQKP